MHYLLSSKSLKYAYYFVLIGLLLFLIFEGKRKQRSIPILAPLKNQSLAFTQTIANMYFENQDHKNIAEQQITYFLEYIRSTFNISTAKLNNDFYKKLASKSNNNVEFVSKLFTKITQIQIKNTITDKELIELNKLIEKFKNNFNGK